MPRRAIVAKRFQSSPGPETGCTSLDQSIINTRMRFNPHPVRRLGATGGRSPSTRSTRVSILTRSGDRVQLAVARPEFGCDAVSILTRSGDRCNVPAHPQRTGVWVSILTRSGDRVQLCVHCKRVRSRRFQSSPGPETGCNILGASTWRALRSFNPHPVRRPGATRARRMTNETSWFQSSPGPETGCNAAGRRAFRRAEAFQSSPGPETGCNAPIAAFPCTSARFNPHPVRRPGATTEG